jgi:hypothetical protein
MSPCRSVLQGPIPEGLPQIWIPLFERQTAEGLRRFCARAGHATASTTSSSSYSSSSSSPSTAARYAGTLQRSNVADDDL